MYLDDNNQFFPAPKIPNGTSGTPPDFKEDNPNWLDLLDVAYYDKNNGTTYGMDAWFNALPPYIKSNPLWMYALDPSGPANYNSGKSIYLCPTSAGLPADPTVNPLVRVIFNYGMNSKGLEGASNVTQLRLQMVAHPSAFVLFSDNRTHVAETPFYGDVSYASILGSPQCYTTRISCRHSAGADIVFSDDHVAYFKYTYICFDDANNRAADPGRPDINWTFNGAPVPPP
jgi:hypothetical protein